VASRHEGALKWLEKHGYDGLVQTFWNKEMTKKVKCGDIVIGNLPIYVIEKILGRGAKVYLIGIPGWPGTQRHSEDRELSADDMDKKGAYLTEVKTLVLNQVKLDI